MMEGERNRGGYQKGLLAFASGPAGAFKSVETEFFIHEEKN